MKVSELEGDLLDYWALIADGWGFYREDNGIRQVGWGGMTRAIPGVRMQTQSTVRNIIYISPSTDWAYSGPIIEREKIVICPFTRDDGKITWCSKCQYKNEHFIDEDIYSFEAKGSTSLEAAMRSFVISKFGDEVSEIIV